MTCYPNETTWGEPFIPYGLVNIKYLHDLRMHRILILSYRTDSCGASLDIMVGDTDKRLYCPFPAESDTALLLLPSHQIPPAPLSASPLVRLTPSPLLIRIRSSWVHVSVQARLLNFVEVYVQMARRWYDVGASLFRKLVFGGLRSIV